MNCSGSSGVDWTSQQNCGPIGSDPFTNKLLVPRGHPGGSTRSSATTEAGWLVANKRAAPAGVVFEFKRYSRRTLGSYRWQVQIASNRDNLLFVSPENDQHVCCLQHASRRADDGKHKRWRGCSG